MLARLSPCLLAGLLAGHAVGQEDSLLRSFERDATTPRKEAPAKPVAAQPAPMRFDANADVGTADDFALRLTLYMIVGGGAYSWARVEPDAAAGIKPREPGEALLVKARLDLAAQHINARTSSQDARVEAGYGPWAIEGRRTRFREELADGAAAHLELRRVHFLYRMAGGDYVELGLGFGRAQMQGVESNSGDSFTLPLLIHPSPHWGLEYRPTWSLINGNTLRDQEFAVLFGYPFASLRAGYRRFESSLAKDGLTLSGPFVGLALRY
jgi:hypothetical protein